MAGLAGVDFRILGPLEVGVGRDRLAYAGEKGGALLALLLLNANRVVSTDQLIDELWGEEPPASGAKALQVRVSQLRKAFAKAGIGELIVTRAPGYLIALPPDGLDLHRFERLVAESDEALAAGDPARAADRLRTALSLWRGPPLAEFGSAPFARVATGRLEELRLAALERRLEADLALGRQADLIGELESLVSEHPFRERLRAQLMLALYRSGRQADALAAYRAAREKLLDELGLEPSESLRELEQAILRHDPELTLLPARDRPAAVSWESPAPPRSILLAPSGTDRLGSLLAIAEPLTKRPPRDLILSVLVEGDWALDAATNELEVLRAGLATRGVPSRIATFTSADRGRDLVRLASEQNVDLLVMDAPDALLASGTPASDLAHVWREAPCDVAVFRATGEQSRLGDGPILAPFGGSEHDWSAVEVAAWLAAAHGTELWLLGSSAEPSRGKRDASRSLAVVSLAVQRVTGISAKPQLVSPGELLDTVRRAGALVVGLSERWAEEGLGATRLALARDAGVPTLLVRRGLRPGGLTPPERMTRYTWSVVRERGSASSSGE